MYFKYHFMITSDFSSSFFGFDLHFCHVFMAHMLLSKTYWIVGVTLMNDVQQVMKIKMGMPWTNFIKFLILNFKVAFSRKVLKTF